MKRLKIGILAVFLALGTQVMAEAPPSTSMMQSSQLSEDQIKAQYKSDKEACNSMSSNAKDICIAEAKGKEKVAKADFDARRDNTEKSRYQALVARADAEYDIAKERCDERADNEKDVCQKDAKAAMVTAKANAEAKFKTFQAMEKADDKSSQAHKKADEKVIDVQQDAAKDKQDANYAAAKERCDSLAGSAKEACLTEAKARHGKL